MRAVWVITRRELMALFLSPLAWAVLAVVQFILAYLFLVQMDTFMTIQPRLGGMEGAPGVTDIIVTPVLSNAAVILLLVVPLLSMRLISEERRQRTLTLLLSAPISMTEIVLGKYLGLIFFFLVLLGITALMPLSLLLGGSLDLGKVASAFLGLWLMICAFSAAGLYLSALSAQPTVAAVGTFGLLLGLWIIDWASSVQADMSGLFAYLSLVRHYESLLKGVFNSADIAYYLLFIFFFLSLSIRALDTDRLMRG